MQQFIPYILRLIYPPQCLNCKEMVQYEFALCARCRAALQIISGAKCDQCGLDLPGTDVHGNLICDQCVESPRPWDRGRAAFRYSGTGRSLVLAFKHNDRLDIAGPAAEWMLGQARDLLTPATLFVPVPMHWRRLLGRRYNQAAELSYQLSKKTQLPQCPDLLVKTYPSSGLGKKTRVERTTELAQSIARNPRREGAAAGKDVILVDDVMTTGATLCAAAHALSDEKTRSISTLTMARTHLDD